MLKAGNRLLLPNLYNSLIVNNAVRECLVTNVPLQRTLLRLYNNEGSSIETESADFTSVITENDGKQTRNFGFKNNYNTDGGYYNNNRFSNRQNSNNYDRWNNNNYDRRDNNRSYGRRNDNFMRNDNFPRNGKDSPSNKYFNSKRNTFSNNKSNRNTFDKYEDPNVIEFQKETMAKLIHLPNDPTTPVEEVTLKGLLDENIVDPMLFKAIDRMGFPTLTSVQQKAIKPILLDSENDIITRAKTGTGKTFAFLIPIFQHLINTRSESQYMIKSIIIAPTRDLALQIESEINKIHKNNYGLKKFQCVSLVGGTSIRKSIDDLYKRRPNIVIATPGRLIDIMDRLGPKLFKYVDFKVLDEADRLLEIGFKQDLEFISETLNSLSAKEDPKHIRTLLFSATLDENVQSLSNNIMNKEKCLFIDTVDKNEPEAHERIHQSMVTTEHFADSIFAVIRHFRAQILETPKNYKAILFTPTVKFTKLISRIISRELGDQIPILEFHGQVTQSRRTNLVRKFKHDESGILICTDVGARGMDFPNVKEVLQIGIPNELSNYVHRIGRTARSGKEGKSILFISKEELPFLRDLKAKKRIEITENTNFEPTHEEKEQFAIRIEFPEELTESIISIISYYRTCVKEYRLNERRILPDIAKSYGILLNEPDRKMPITRHFLERIGLARNPIASRMFEITHHNSSGSSSRYGSEENEENENDFADDGYVNRSYSRNNSRNQRYGNRNDNNSRQRSNYSRQYNNNRRGRY